MKINEVADKFGIKLPDVGDLDIFMERINRELQVRPRNALHIKSRTQYLVTKVVLNCTNANDGEFMIMYYNQNHAIPFVRESSEFFEKFRLC